MQSLLDPCPMEIIGIFKNWKSPFPWKNNFCPNLGKKDPEWLLNGVLNFLKNFVKMKTYIFLLLLIFHHQPHICNISRKQWMMNFIFGMQIDIEVLHKVILSSWVCIARYAQSTLNEKFAYFCIISRKTWGWSWFFVCR